ncbi:MAG TPA: glycosyl transferase family protein [Candidatus Sulfopaludibacter sp.]|nr:glycosyl transferase family protein [Candidatus Sulfopaludibacter sp.]
MPFDHWLSACLGVLAVWILISGLDDLFVSLVWMWARDGYRWPGERELSGEAERRVAIFVPLWQEDGVIRQMLEHNLAAIRYRNFDVFVGVYPNDEATRSAVEEVAARDERIHIATVPRDGPTSKGDCLNAIYRRMLAYEAGHDVRFRVILTHDAEDLIHPESLRLINWHMREYQMVQVPVLALATGLRELTHGLYCDEFAEYQSKDIPVRQRLGGFLPSNGVGTGFDRDALEALADARGGLMFDPACLTEDYETGYRLHAQGCRQIFVPLRFDGRPPVATREYFPRRLRAAVRQRSRWVTGIALQGWQHHGWKWGTRQAYWFWRDRKGLVGNLLSPVVNGLFVWGAVDARVRHQSARWMVPVFAATAVITLVQMGCRAAASGRVYGWRFATGVPLRMVWGNVVNCLATVAALRQFAGAALWRERLAWRKTEHDYPVHARPRLGEVLVRMRLLPAREVEAALRSKPASRRLGEHLMLLEKISAEHLHLALSRQASGD